MGAHANYDKDKAVKLYLDGLSSDKIGKSFGVSGVAIRQLLKRRNIERRQDHQKPKLALLEEAELCKRYASGESASNLAPEFGVSINSVGRILRRRGIEVRSMSETHRHHKCDHHFFDQVDTEEKAYWLGFIAADGYIGKPDSTNSSVLVVSLSPMDKDHLYRLRSSLKSTHSIYEYDYSESAQRGKAVPYASFNIRSPELVAGLARFGIVSRKSQIIRWPELPDPLLRHFLRGNFDGDGTWNLRVSYKNGQRQPDWKADVAFRLSSNREFLEGCQQYMMRACNLNKTTLSTRKDCSTCTLIYGGRKQTRRIFHLMYDDATIYLPRKREKAAPHI